MSKQSREAFLELVRSGERDTKARQVYMHLSGRRMTTQELRNETGMPHQTLAARVSELMDYGIVEQDDDGYFYHASPDRYTMNATLREQERYLRWLNLGRENGWLRSDGHPQPPKPRRVVLSRQTSIFDIL